MTQSTKLCLTLILNKRKRKHKKVDFTFFAARYQKKNLVTSATKYLSMNDMDRNILAKLRPQQV